MPLMMYISFMPWNVDESVLRSDAGMTVTDADDAIIFAPVTAQPDSALLLLPGCPVDPRAYAPPARRVASKGLAVDSGRPLARRGTRGSHGQRAPDHLRCPDLMGTSHPRLPIATAWVRIGGGNHSQFAYYGFQLFDHRATISREQQQDRVKPPF
jgi:hypothetical protein